jgi:hypothetical protein
LNCDLRSGFYFLRELLLDFDSFVLVLLLPEEAGLLSLLLLFADAFSRGADCLDVLTVSDL